jgi:hypothetical protein
MFNNLRKVHPVSPQSQLIFVTRGIDSQSKSFKLVAQKIDPDKEADFDKIFGEVAFTEGDLI